MELRKKNGPLEVAGGKYEGGGALILCIFLIVPTILVLQ